MHFVCERNRIRFRYETAYVSHSHIESKTVSIEMSVQPNIPVPGTRHSPNLLAPVRHGVYGARKTDDTRQVIDLNMAHLQYYRRVVLMADSNQETHVT